MKVFIFAVGRLKEPFWTAAEAEYLKRLKRYAQVEVREVKDDAALLAALPMRSRLIALDERGDLWTSADIAERLIRQGEQHGGGLPLVFVIGGAEGLPPSVRAKAHAVLALGRITLPHRLARVVLLEQIYRAYTIVRGEPYHR